MLLLFPSRRFSQIKEKNNYEPYTSKLCKEGCLLDAHNKNQKFRCVHRVPVESIEKKSFPL